MIEQLQPSGGTENVLRINPDISPTPWIMLPPDSFGLQPKEGKPHADALLHSSGPY